jgi:hypothetical protein
MLSEFKSNAYHPESQVTLERFHDTLKNIMKTFCFDRHIDWGNGVRMLMFAVLETFQESLGFSPCELFLDTLWEFP